VVRALVVPVGLLLQLHQDVVGQAAGAEAEPVVAEPFGAELLLHHHQVVQGLLAGADAAGGLHGDHLPGLQVVVADGVQHHQGHLHGGRRVDLARAGLDEVGPGGDGDVAGQTHLVVGAELAGFQDHFQAGIAAGLLDGGDLVEDEGVVTAVELGRG
jgi:hypothetical protein